MQPPGLATPDLVHLSLLFEVIADIRQLDRPALPDAAFRSGVRHAIEERLPPLPGPLDWPAAQLPPGSTPADAAGYIYGQLAWNTGPATAVLARLARAPVTIEVTRCAARRLTADEAAAMDAGEDSRCYEREGLMTAGRVTVARVRLLIVQSRIPAAALEAILSGKPAGEVLEPYGMARDRCRAGVSRENATVDTSAILRLGSLTAGQAEEHIGRQFCEHVAALAG